VRLLVLIIAACLSAAAQTQPEDLILRSLAEELDRAKTLRLAGVDEPYYTEYAIDDVQSFGVVCSQGAVISSTTNRVRLPRVQLRVGDYAFDNTNYVFSDFFGRIGGARLPLDDDPFVLRHHFWLLTDRAFKGSVEAIARKRAALRNVTVQEELGDFSKAKPVTLIVPDRPAA